MCLQRARTRISVYVLQPPSPISPFKETDKFLLNVT